MMARRKDIEVEIAVSAASFTKAFERVRYTMSPLNSALSQVSRAVEDHIMADSRVGANKRTVAVFMAAQRLYEIDEGVKAGTHDSLGYPIEDEEEGR